MQDYNTEPFLRNLFAISGIHPIDPSFGSISDMPTAVKFLEEATQMPRAHLAARVGMTLGQLGVFESRGKPVHIDCMERFARIAEECRLPNLQAFFVRQATTRRMSSKPLRVKTGAFIRE